MGRNGRVDAAVAAASAVLAAFVRLPNLDRPRTLVFDEEYYVRDALRYLGRAPGNEVSWVHPPLGKWLIAGGIEIAGDRPIGWRTTAALAGIATVVLTYLVARHVLPRWAAAAAALFVTFDGLAIVHGRVSMLDGLLTPLMLAAVLAVLPALIDDDRPDPPWWRLGVAGALLGAAVAVKWAAAPALLVLLVVAGIRWRPRGKLLSGFVICLVAVPAFVYVASYARLWADGADLAAFVRLQRWMLEFHQNLEATHPYGSEASSWLLLRRPVAYHFESRDGTVREILALGNPALWWGFLAAVPLLLVRWWRSRDPAIDLVVVALATMYLPWIVTFRQGFLFYLTPLVPFLAIGLAASLVAIVGTGPVRLLRGVPAAVVSTCVVVVGLLYLPLWVGSPVSESRWHSLMLFDRWI